MVRKRKRGRETRRSGSGKELRNDEEYKRESKVMITVNNYKPTALPDHFLQSLLG